MIYTLGLAVLWIVLASLRPATTYHLAPFLVAGAGPITYAVGDNSRSASYVTGAAVIALVVALAAIGLLTVFGALDGPSLLSTGGALFESVVLALAGAVLGWGLALVAKRR